MDMHMDIAYGLFEQCNIIRMFSRRVEIATCLWYTESYIGLCTRDVHV